MANDRLVRPTQAPPNNNMQRTAMRAAATFPSATSTTTEAMAIEITR